MKPLFFLLLFVFLAQSIACQHLNRGKPDQRKYFTEIPFTLERDKIVVEAELQGERSRFILDTGAPLLLETTVADELQLPVIGSKTLHDAAGNKGRSALVRVPALTLGEVTFRDVPAPTAPLRGSVLECFQVDGFIGSNLLRHSVIQFDWQRGIITITDHAKKLGLDKQDAIDIRVTKNQSSPYIPMFADGDIRIWTLLDTGSDDYFTVSNDQIKRVQQQQRWQDAVISRAGGSASMGLFGATDNGEAFLLALDSLSMAEIPLDGPLLIESGPDDDAKVGTRLLTQGTLTIDYPRKRLWFQPYPDRKPDLPKRFGLGFVPTDSLWKVTEVWTGSAADSAGIQVGDILLEYGSVNLRQSDLCPIFFSLPSVRQAEQIEVVYRRPEEATERTAVLTPRATPGT